MTALGRPWKGSYKRTNLPNFIDARNLSPFIPSDLNDVLEPVEFVNMRGQRVQGYRAELLQMVCDVYLDAREADALTPSQERIAAQAEVLIRGFARVGIISLVDEATGYQRDRASDALATILRAFIAKELQPWVHTFPDQFYEHASLLDGSGGRSPRVFPARCQSSGMMLRAGRYPGSERAGGAISASAQPPDRTST